MSARCSSCNAPVIWCDTPNGKAMILDEKPEKRGVISPKTGLVHIVDTYMPHWATCPSADDHRQPSLFDGGDDGR